MVGVSGFEPEASWTRTKRDTKLRHTRLYSPLNVSHPDGSYRIPQLPEECKPFFQFFRFYFFVRFLPKKRPLRLVNGGKLCFNWDILRLEGRSCL